MLTSLLAGLVLYAAPGLYENVGAGDQAQTVGEPANRVIERTIADGVRGVDYGHSGAAPSGPSGSHGGSDSDGDGGDGDDPNGSGSNSGHGDGTNPGQGGGPKGKGKGKGHSGTNNPNNSGGGGNGGGSGGAR